MDFRFWILGLRILPAYCLLPIVFSIARHSPLTTRHLQRQPHDKLTALAESFALGFDAAAMQRDQAFDQRKPDAKAAFGAAGLALAEHLEAAAK